MNSISSCDLHIHSYYSDGAMSPEAIVRVAADTGLSAISIADHDTAAGQPEAIGAGDTLGVDIVTGIEFSVKENDLDIHILGYCVGLEDERLPSVLDDLERGRAERAEKIAEKLQDLGLPVTLEEIMEDAGAGTVGRPHVARVLMRKEIVTGFQEAFDRFLGYGASCYVPKRVLSLEDVVSVIKGAGGVAVWAHPGANIRKKKLRDRILGCGVEGIEAWHPNHTEEISRLAVKEAERRGLVCTGGSDYHFDEAMKASIGEIEVPYGSVRELRRLASGLSA
jgi:predicted metal-dependent phosphoesterase TrpH